MQQNKVPLISIIVPVYNAERYIHRCIKSILSQKISNFELILIDDGSLDNSGKICNEYAQKDCRIKVIHKENAGASAARNDGIEVAIGKWIAFIDADDYIECDYLEYLIKYSNNADFIISSNYFVQNQEDILYKNQQDIINYLSITQYSNGFLWAKLFKRDIINKNNVKMDIKIRFMEDNLFIIDYLLNCHTIQLLSHNYYHITLENNIPSEKYNLQFNDITYIVEQYEKRRILIKKITNSNILPFPKILVAMYPLRSIIINKSDDEYYKLYKKYYPNASKNDFYNNSLISPITRMIAAAKILFKQGKIEDADIFIDYLIKTCKNTKYKPNGKLNILIWLLIKLRFTVLLHIILTIYGTIKSYDKK